MQFLFWLANHNHLGQQSLEDVIEIFGQQLWALGHKAVWDPTHQKMLDRKTGINVLVEGFSEGSIGIIAGMHAQGARFVILATEEPTARGFNHGWDPAMVKRQQIFPEAAKYAEAIFHLVPGDHVTRWFSQFAPTAYVELGYAPSLVRPPDNIEPDYDFGFYGTLSQRRYSILKRMGKMTGKAFGGVRVVADFAKKEERDREMRRARVILQIRKHEKMGLVSSSRLSTSLCIGRPVVAEPHALCDPWDKIVKFSKTLDTFYNDAFMTKAMWRSIHADQFERFKTTMTPEACVGRALDAVGILKRELV